jgi:hypothetical protein
MSQTTQQFKKVFDCMTCKKPIKLSRKADNSGWDRFELDGVTPHVCNKTKKEAVKQQSSVQQQPKQQQQQITTNSNSSSNRSLSERLDSIEKRLESIQALLELLVRK